MFTVRMVVKGMEVVKSESFHVLLTYRFLAVQLKPVQAAPTGKPKFKEPVKGTYL